MIDVKAGGARFTVTYSEPFGPTDAAAGVVAIDAAHMLTVVSAEPAYGEKLALVASMLNSSEEFLLNANPPEGVQTRRQYRRTVARDSAEARAALLEILREKYGFTLSPG
jgi:hypothetical protein